MRYRPIKLIKKNMWTLFWDTVCIISVLLASVSINRTEIWLIVDRMTHVNIFRSVSAMTQIVICSMTWNMTQPELWLTLWLILWLMWLTLWLCYDSLLTQFWLISDSYYDSSDSFYYLIRVVFSHPKMYIRTRFCSIRENSNKLISSISSINLFSVNLVWSKVGILKVETQHSL